MKIFLKVLPYLALMLLGFGIRQYLNLRETNSTLTEENKSLKGKVIDLALKNDSLKITIAEFSETMERYQEVLKEVGAFVMRECPEVIKKAQGGQGPQLRRPQSMPAPSEVEHPPLPIEM
jgi:hypothetical protein